MITEQKQNCLKPYFYSAEMTLDQLITLTWTSFRTIKKAKLGPVNNFTAYISYYLVQVWGFQWLLSGPSRGYYLVQVCFLAYFIVVSSDV